MVSQTGALDLGGVKGTETWLNLMTSDSCKSVKGEKVKQTIVLNLGGCLKVKIWLYSFAQNP